MTPPCIADVHATVEGERGPLASRSPAELNRSHDTVEMLLTPRPSDPFSP